MLYHLFTMHMFCKRYSVSVCINNKQDFSNRSHKSEGKFIEFLHRKLLNWHFASIS